MATYTSKIVPAFDFSAASEISVQERFQQCIEKAKRIVDDNGYQNISDFPCVPNRGASEEDLQALERNLGVPLPAEYRQFLSMCRYLKLDDGLEIGGLDYEGLYVAESPWRSQEHRKGVDYLVIANYWRYADGDQLLVDLSEPDQPVIAYLHEHGPLFEFYAPSFSLALWRLLHERSE